MNWRIKSKGLFFRADESAVVYYDPYSGDTHLLSEFAASIIDLVPTDGITSAELLERLLPQSGQPDSGQLHQAMLEVLEELAGLHILWRCG